MPVLLNRRDAGKEVETLSSTTLRVIGILVLVAAAVVAVLNLKRVANLGMMWLSPPLLVVGVALVTLAARKK
jgi:cytochrome bd-type quinol oxidase subunit 2